METVDETLEVEELIKNCDDPYVKEQYQKEKNIFSWRGFKVHGTIR